MAINRTKWFAGIAAAAAIASGGASSEALPNAVAAGPRTTWLQPDFPATKIGPPEDPKKPNIVVIDAGGTLSATARDRISYQHYQGSAPNGVQGILEDMYPELGAVANLTVLKSPVSIGSSGAVTAQILYTISREIDAQLKKGNVDGVVVTAGTSVLEEDAYFFDLTVQSKKPVVVTGAMHQYGTFTYDGYTNLFSSVRLAASAKTTCYGTVVLLNDEFYAARDVTKTDGYRMDTFGSRTYGALGVVNEDNIRTMRAPARVMKCGSNSWKTPFDLTKKTPDQFAKVDVVYGDVEGSGATIAGLVDAGDDGIVTAGFGPGDLSRAQSMARTAAIAQGVLFAQATRTGGEGYYDSGTNGVIGAGDLLPQKAKLLLQLGLTFSGDQAQVRHWFKSVGDPEFDLSDFS